MSRIFIRSICALPYITLLLATVVAGCSGDCERASDCLRDEVCFNGECTPSLSSDLICQGDDDCNAAGGTELVCIGNLCQIDPGSVVAVCSITPRCFDTGAATPISPQVMTATTGSALADEGAELSGVIALSAPGSSVVNIVGQNTDTGRYMCISLDSVSQTCDVMQVADGDPSDPQVNVYQSLPGGCTTMLTNTTLEIEGQASAFLQDCSGDAFSGEADFRVAIQ